MVEDGLEEEGVEMVADDVKKGSVPIRLANQAKTEEQKNKKCEGIRSGRSKKRQEGAE